MLSPFGITFGLFADGFAIAMLMFSLYYILRQRIPRLADAKYFVAAAYITFSAVAVLDFLRNIAAPEFITIYTLGSITLVLWSAIFLGCVGYIVHVLPPEKTFSGRARAFFESRLRPHGIVLLAYIAYLLSVNAYFVVYGPYRLVTLTNLSGAEVLYPRFNLDFAFLALVTLAVFILYPSLQFFMAARSAPGTQVRRAIAILALSWDATGVIILVFNTYFVAIGIDAVAVDLVMIAVVFAGSAGSFRRVVSFADLLVPMGESIPVTDAFSKSLGLDHNIGGGTMLIEVDTSTNYENPVRDFVKEQVSGGRIVFVFTFGGSPVFKALQEIPEIRFYTMSDVSYPKPTTRSNEIQVPRNDIAVMLDVLDQSTSSIPETGKAIVFDNVSDLMVAAGLEESYKFLRQASVILSEKKVTALFLVVAKAHEEKAKNLLRTLFPHILRFGPEGLSKTK